MKSFDHQSRTLKAIAAVMVISCVTWLFFYQDAEAYCVYNRTKHPIKVRQFPQGSGFHAVFNVIISAGDHKCCNWENDECNPDGKRDSKLKFRADWADEGTFDDTLICENKVVRAGGWLTISGSKSSPRCAAHYDP